MKMVGDFILSDLLAFSALKSERPNYTYAYVGIHLHLMPMFALVSIFI